MLNKKFVQEKLKTLPKDPGVYIYRNEKNRVIYVGKAVNLKNRVNSYFKGEHDVKTRELVKNIANLEWIVTGSEIEALVLESELIKRYKPKYNIDWKDDKNYSYLKITNELYPRISVVRQIIDDKARYLGPYIDANALRTSLKTLRKVFPYCTCSLSPDRVCLYYHIGLCKGHGEKYISPKEYQLYVKNLVDFMGGKREQVLKDLRKEMSRFSKEKKYEQAAFVRDQISALVRLRFEHVIEEKRDINLDKALTGLQTALGLTKAPERIECYDISNIFGRAAVGSMVVFEKGIPKKSDYRRFEIKTVKRIDDFAMHREIANRRFSYFASEKLKVESKKNESFSKLPDLVIIDGGKGQLSSVLEVVKPLKLPTKFIGLAKRYEDLVTMDSEGNFGVVTLEPNSEAFFLVQRIRDEAHRFAITYHRNLRSKELTSSKLDSIPGIGPKTKKKLIKEFGTIEKIKKAPMEELNKVVNEKIAKTIKETL